MSIARQASDQVQGLGVQLDSRLFGAEVTRQTRAWWERGMLQVRTIPGWRKLQVKETQAREEEVVLTKWTWEVEKS